MDFDKFTFRQIDADTRIKSFDCGDADLNDFLFSDAINYYKSMMALTYLLEDNEAGKTVAYYSLLNDKIVFDPDEKKFWNRLNRHVATMRRSAYRFITVDAYAAAVPFYEKCGFMFLSEKDKHSSTRSMYFDLINFLES